MKHRSWIYQQFDQTVIIDLATLTDRGVFDSESGAVIVKSIVVSEYIEMSCSRVGKEGGREVAGWRI